MTTSTSRLAYDDIFDLFERADANGWGVKVTFDKFPTLPENRGEAIQFRVRIHTARQIDRHDNLKNYPEVDHPLHGRSKYDIYRASIKDYGTEAHLYLEKRTLNRMKIEDLNQGEVNESA